MQISTSIPNIVCIWPFRTTGVSQVVFERCGGQGWSASDWQDYFPRQFRQSYPNARFIDQVREFPVDGRFGDACGLLANSRTLLAMFDENIGCLMLMLDADPESLTEHGALKVYGGLVHFKERYAKELIEAELRGRGFTPGFELDLTWTFSINLAYVCGEELPPASIDQAFSVICNEKPGRYVRSQAPLPLNAVQHVPGSTGSLCIIPGANDVNFAYRRVLSLWMIFYTYASVSMFEYAALARENKRLGGSPAGSDATSLLRNHEERYHRLTSLLYVFEPVNVCTRGFDYEIYEGCWNNDDMEALSVKLRGLSLLFVESLREARAEITRRYEKVMQFLLAFIAFTQLIPLVKEVLKSAPWTQSHATDLWATLSMLAIFLAAAWLARRRSMRR